MNQIKGLLIKDLRNMKSYKSTIFAFLVLFFLTGLAQDTTVSFMPVCMTVCFGMMATSSFSYDHLANSDRYLLTLPISRKDIVKARYLYAILMTMVGAVIGNILAILFLFFKVGDVGQIADCLMTGLGGIFGIMVLQLFQMPIMYKFGAEKGRLIQMIAILLVTVGLSSIIAFFTNLSPFSFEEWETMFKNYGLLLIGIIVVILYFVSYQISVRIFSKKEI